MLCNCCEPLAAFFRSEKATWVEKLEGSEDGFEIEVLYPDVGCVSQGAKLGCPFCSLLITYGLPESLRTNGVNPDDPNSVNPITRRNGEEWYRGGIPVGWRNFISTTNPRPGAVLPYSLLSGGHWELAEPYPWESPHSWRVKFCEHGELSFNIVLLKAHECLQDGRWAGTNLFKNPLSNGAVAMMCNWIEECQTTHAGCLSNGESKLPQRVIDVSSEFHPKLIESNGVKTAYVTLSHRWGDIAPMTTSKTIDQHLKEIPWSKLPKSFKDAIIVTRKLRIQYLWIDSLCIVQDDNEDKAEEVAQMANIYRSAYVNVTAAAGRNSHAGFISDRTEGACPIKLLDNGQEQENVYAIPPIPRWGDDVEKSLTNQRAWVLQERLLSRRVIHFGERQIYWECHTRANSESGTLTNGPRQNHPSLFGFKRMLEHVQIFAPYRNWYRLVEEYSARSISDPKDKLPAISALAKEFAHKVDSDYCAGIFRKDILRGLLWRVKSKESVSPGDIQVPSWSWASLHASVDYMPLWNERERYATVLQCDVSPKDRANEFGRVASGGFICIRGPIESFPSVSNCTTPGRRVDLDSDLWNLDTAGNAIENTRYVTMMIMSFAWSEVNGNHHHDERDILDGALIIQCALILRSTGKQFQIDQSSYEMFVRVGVVLVDFDDEVSEDAAHSNLETIVIV